MHGLWSVALTSKNTYFREKWLPFPNIFKWSNNYFCISMCLSLQMVRIYVGVEGLLFNTELLPFFFNQQNIKIFENNLSKWWLLLRSSLLILWRNLFYTKFALYDT